MKMKYALLTALALFPMLSAQVATPAFIDYQGTVFDAATGAPLGSDGANPNFTANPTNYTMQFKVFGSESGADLVWAETQTVTVSLGLFSVRLGSGAEIAGLIPAPTKSSIADAFDGSDRFLELTVFPAGSNTGNAITPRLKFQSAPFAFTAKHAALADEVVGKVTATAGSSFAGAIDFNSATFTGGVFNGGSFVGDVTGNVTGVLTGNVMGDVTGNVAGVLTGNVMGDVTGNVTGTLTGDVTGDVSGTAKNITGQLADARLSGNVALLGRRDEQLWLGTQLFNQEVGIGARPTKGILHVAGLVNDDSYFSGANGAIVTFRELNSAGEITRAWQIGNPINTTLKASIYAEANVVASIFYAISDSRVKRIEGLSDSARDLDTILGIEVTDYSFIDTLSKGTGTQKKVIAQQVEKVFPQAVSQSTDVIPDIFQQASIQDGWVTLATNLKKGERVRLLGEKNEKGVYEVLEIAEGKFRTEFKPTTDKVFVYGREVDDFRTVDYEAISMLNVSATQQVKKELDAVKTENAALKSRLEALEAKDRVRDAQLSVLMKQFSAPERTTVRTRNHSNATQVAR